MVSHFLFFVNIVALLRLRFSASVSSCKESLRSLRACWRHHVCTPAMFITMTVHECAFYEWLRDGYAKCSLARCVNFVLAANLPCFLLQKLATSHCGFYFTLVTELSLLGSWRYPWIPCGLSNSAWHNNLLE